MRKQHLLAEHLPGLLALGGAQLLLQVLLLRRAQDGAVRVLHVIGTTHIMRVRLKFSIPDQTLVLTAQHRLQRCLLLHLPSTSGAPRCASVDRSLVSLKSPSRQRCSITQRFLTEFQGQAWRGAHLAGGAVLEVAADDAGVLRAAWFRVLFSMGLPVLRVPKLRCPPRQGGR